MSYTLIKSWIDFPFHSVLAWTCPPTVDCIVNYKPAGTQKYPNVDYSLEFSMVISFLTKSSVLQLPGKSSTHVMQTSYRFTILLRHHIEFYYTRIQCFDGRFPIEWLSYDDFSPLNIFVRNNFHRSQFRWHLRNGTKNTQNCCLCLV